MPSFSRRSFLQSSAATVAGLAASNLGAIEPLQRVNPHIAGLSMAAYSMLAHLNWFLGEPTEGKLDMLGFLDYCAELGLDGAELTAYFFERPVTTSRLNELKRRAHLNGLDITSGAIGNDFSRAPKSDRNREQAQYVTTWIDHFADLGAPSLRVFASRGDISDMTTDQVIDNVTNNLEVALKHAEKRGVMLGLENHDFTENIDHLLTIIKRIDSPWLGVTWDSANIAPTNDPYAELERIAPYASVAQLKVMTKVDGKRVPADYERLIKILRNANYGGYVVFEYEEEEDPYKAIPANIEKLKKVIGSR